MAMLRRLHALGSKSGSDPAAQLLRTLSSRTAPRRNSPEIDGDAPPTQKKPDAIGPPVRASHPGLTTGNRGLCGLADAGRAGGGWHLPGLPKGMGLRSLTTAEASNQCEEDSDEDGRLLNGIHEARAKALEMDSIDVEDGYDTDEFYNSSKFTRSSNAVRRAGSQESMGLKGYEAEASGSSATVSDDSSSSSKMADAGDLSNFDLNPRVQRNLRSAGVEKLFPVQAQCFEKATLPGKWSQELLDSLSKFPVVNGQDLICKSRTGSGKTLAFAIPIIEALDRQSGGGESVAKQRGGRGRAFLRGARGRLPRAIVVAPTRELAKQVEREFNRVAPDLTSLAVYGGTAIGPQIQELRGGVDVIVGTPGRIIDHIEQGHLRLHEIQFCVLDEADLMLQMGFQEPVEEIFKEMPENKQTTLWSATMPQWVQQLAGRYLDSPDFIDMVGEDDVKIPATIEHWSFAAQRDTRLEILAVIATMYGANKRSMIFTQTKAEVDELCTNVALSKLGAEALHGGLSQGAREATLARFRSGRTKVLVATDVASRGLDIPGVDMVLHYRLPNDQESFVHRSGRTGRAGKSGINIILCSGVEEQQLAALEKEYSFASVRRATPSSGSMVKNYAQEIKTKILGVSGASLALYREEAQDLLRRMGLSTPDEAGSSGDEAKIIPDEGVEALSAAMALLGGAEAGVGGEAFSMIDGRRGYQSVLIVAPQLKRNYAAQDLVAFINDSGCLPRVHRYRKTSEGVLMDFPSSGLDETLGILEKQVRSHPNYAAAKVEVPDEVQGMVGAGRGGNSFGRRGFKEGGFGGGGNRSGGGGYQGRYGGQQQGGGYQGGRGGYRGGGGGGSGGDYYSGGRRGGYGNYGGGGGRGQGRF